MLRIVLLLLISFSLLACASSPPAVYPAPVAYPAEPSSIQPLAVVNVVEPRPVVSRPPDYPFTGCLPVLNNLSNEEANEIRWHMEKAQTWFQQMDRIDTCDSARIAELSEPVLRTEIVRSVYAVFRKARAGCGEHYQDLIRQIRDWENTFLDHRRCQ